MEINNAMYSLKKCIKRIENNDINLPQITAALLDIRKLLYGLKLDDQGYELREISKVLASGQFNSRSIISKMEHILNDMKKVKEKASIMRQRECRATINFNDEKRRSKKNNYGCSRVSNISKYDVILAPTQGGFHYCVVTEVIPNKQVTCYPMTTAQTKDLDMLGCKYYPLSGVDGSHQNTVLTSACTTIPYRAALNCFVEKMNFSEELGRAIEYVQMQSESMYY